MTERDTRGWWRVVRDEWKWANKRNPLNMPGRELLKGLWPLIVCIVVMLAVYLTLPAAAENGEPAAESPTVAAEAAPEDATENGGSIVRVYAGLFAVLGILPGFAFFLVRMYLWAGRRRWKLVRAPCCAWCGREDPRLAAHESVPEISLARRKVLEPGYPFEGA